MDFRNDGTGLVAILLASLVSMVLWVGLVYLLRWLSGIPLEVMVKATAATLMLLGSWLVIRACVELDR